MKKLIENVIELCKTKHGKNIGIFDNSFLEQSLNGRMSFLYCNNKSDFYKLLSTSESESLAFINSLTNSYSEFFRSPLTFSILEQHILPLVFKSNQANKVSGIRIWSAGCALGQEPYSIAILCEDLIQPLSLKIPYTIFATDISINEIFKAKSGRYDYNTIKNTRFSFVTNYFSEINNEYIINEDIRSKVNFSYYDLLDTESTSPSASIYGDFDIVFCSNLLFYYKPEVQEFIVSKIHRSLKRGGYFITGEAETAIVKSFKGFKQFVSIAPIFIKI